MSGEPWWMHPEKLFPDIFREASAETQPVYNQEGPSCAYAAIQNQLGFSLGSNRDAALSKIRDFKIYYFGYDKPLAEIRASDDPAIKEYKATGLYMQEVFLREPTSNSEYAGAKGMYQAKKAWSAYGDFDDSDLGSVWSDVEEIYGKGNVRKVPNTDLGKIKNGFLSLWFEYTKDSPSAHRVAVKNGWVLDSNEIPSWKLEEKFARDVSVPWEIFKIYQSEDPDLSSITGVSGIEITEPRVGQLAPRYDGLPIWHDEYKTVGKAAVKRIFSPIRQTPYDRRRAPLKFTFPKK